MPVRPDILFLDANVLYSACCRDLLLEAALDGLCHCRWSDQVLSEVRTVLLRQRPDLRPSQVDRLFDLLGLACPEARHVVRPRCSLRLPKLIDESDAHVISVACAAGADAIVTFNLRHFPSHVLKPLGIKALSPDRWLLAQAEQHPDRIRALVERCRQRLRHPPLSRITHLKALRSAGLPLLADYLER
jgi:predicted nucleic acid-binding protein